MRNELIDRRKSKQIVNAHEDGLKKYTKMFTYFKSIW